MSMRQRRSGTAIVPRSNVHIHSVTLGESLELIKKLNCHQRTTRIDTEGKTGNSQDKEETNKIAMKRTD